VDRLVRAIGEGPLVDRRGPAVAALRRPLGEPLRVIAEVKRASPSAGMIRERRIGDAVHIARAYETAGAAAVSVLADGPGFAGSPLDVRRVAAAVQCPVLFKEFVVDPIQVTLARALGASLVLLLVRARRDDELVELVERVVAAEMAPVVEAADASELGRALATRAPIVGVNARDLHTFRVDPAEARRLVQTIPRGRVAVFMSGVREPADLRMLGSGRADAVLVGEALMRADDPGARLRSLLEGTQ
jgi:indole-3-glycerol phosphate synthase